MSGTQRARLRAAWQRLRQAPSMVLLLALYLPALLVSFGEGMLGPVLPLYARSLDASYGLVGLVSAGAGLGMVLSDVPGGLLVRRLGQKRAMLLGLACSALSTAALFWAGSIYEVVLYRIFTGFGGALFAVARHAYVADAVRTGVRGRAIGLLGGVFRIGHFTGPALGGTIAKMWGLRFPFILVAASLAAALIAVIVFVPTPSRTATAAARKVRPSSLGAMLRSRLRVLAPAGIGHLFAQMIRAGRGTIIPLYGADVLGLDVQAIGFILSFAAAIDVLFFYPAGWIMDHLGRKWSIVPSFLIQALGMACIPLAGSFAGLLAASAVICLGNGLGSGSMMTLGADLAPPEARGEFLGVWLLIGDAGTSGGPLIIGRVADMVTLPAAALIIAAAGLLSGAIFTFLVPETLPRPGLAAGQAQESTAND